jgi:hypothetical protein
MLAACGRSPLGPFVVELDDADHGGGTISRVDVVLAVDDSNSMEEEIAALQGPVFDAFPSALLSIGNGLVDFRLAVIDGCITPPNFHDWGESGDCGFASGASYMVSSDPAFSAEYACVMELTTRGWHGQADECTGSNDDEQPASTAAAALARDDGPNAGFLRDSASLFVVVITDEDEAPMPSRTPGQIADALVAPKGDIDDVFMLGIGAERECDGPYGEAHEAETLHAVTDVFIDAGRGVWWDLCDGRLEDAFAAAIAELEAAS